MSSGSDSDDVGADDGCDLLKFVKLLEDNQILLEKSQTPSAKKKKKSAALSVAEALGPDSKGNSLTYNQITKKISNLKRRLKKITDVKRTGNKPIPELSPWQKKLYALVSPPEKPNPEFEGVPGSMNAGICTPPDESSSIKLLVKKPRTSSPLHDLQEKCLNAQIEAACAQKTAADKQVLAAEAMLNAANCIIRHFGGNRVPSATYPYEDDYVSDAVYQTL